jgi:hypothetical protein
MGMGLFFDYKYPFSRMANSSIQINFSPLSLARIPIFTFNSIQFIGLILHGGTVGRAEYPDGLHVFG